MEVMKVFYMDVEMPKEGQIQHNRMEAYLRACSGSRREKIFRRRPNKKWPSRAGHVLIGCVLIEIFICELEPVFVRG